MQQKVQVQRQMFQSRRSKRTQGQAVHLPDVQRLRVGRKGLGDHQKGSLRHRVRQFLHNQQYANGRMKVL